MPVSMDKSEAISSLVVAHLSIEALRGRPRPPAGTSHNLGQTSRDLGDPFSGLDKTSKRLYYVVGRVDALIGGLSDARRHSGLFCLRRIAPLVVMCRFRGQRAGDRAPRRARCATRSLRRACAQLDAPTSTALLEVREWDMRALPVLLEIGPRT